MAAPWFSFLEKQEDVSVPEQRIAPIPPVAKSKEAEDSAGYSNFFSQFQPPLPKAASTSTGASKPLGHRRGSGQTSRSSTDALNGSKLSKALSSVLRHRAEQLCLKIRPDGFVAIPELLTLRQFRHLELSDLEEVCASNEKARFTMMTADGIAYIRANQGHTMSCVKDDELLEPVRSPSELKTVIHGTFRKCWPSILKSGLKPMDRIHIHLLRLQGPLEDPTPALRGMRLNSELAIFIDVVAAMQEGVSFGLSDNGVVLSRGLPGQSGIPPRHFLKVVSLDVCPPRLFWEPPKYQYAEQRNSLIAMGFSEETTDQALAKVKGDIELALAELTRRRS